MQTNTTTTQNSAGPTTTNDARPLSDLTGFQRDLLRTIAALDEPYGLGIRDELEADYGEEINHARLYANLRELCDADLVEKGWIDARTNSYTLTDEGERAFIAHLRWMRSTSTGGAD